MNIFVTGGSGFLGSAFLIRLAELRSVEKIYLLMRHSEKKTAYERTNELLHKIFPPEKLARVAKKIVAIPGDLIDPRMGISANHYFELTKKVHQILHVGASTDFGLPIEESRLYNVSGTKHVLELAENCKREGQFSRFEYISTAFVAGTLRGEVKENDLERNQTFANPYEQSKFEAEKLVRRYGNKFPIAIYRPSIVVGHSKNGYTPHFKVLYWPLKVLSTGFVPFIPANRNAKLDVVPIDYVADAVTALMQEQSSIGETFHITAGAGNEVRLVEVVKDSRKFAKIEQKPLIPWWVFQVIRSTPLKRIFSQDFWSIAEIAMPYKDYLRGNGVTFNNDRTRSVLEKLGIVSPKWEDYKDKILSYCHTSRWGKIKSRPEYFYYLDDLKQWHNDQAEVGSVKPVASRSPFVVIAGQKS